MQSGAHCLHSDHEICTAAAASNRTSITYASWRPVGNEDVGVLRDRCPFAGEFLASRQVEGPVVVGGLPRASPKANAVDSHARVLKVDGVPNEFECGFSFSREAPIMVSRHDQFGAMGQRTYPSRHTFKLDELTGTKHVASVHEHIAVGNRLEVCLKRMGVRDRDNPHGMDRSIVSKTGTG